MNITDKIDLLIREYTFDNGTPPTMLKLNIGDFALLREALGLNIEADLEMYRGMVIVGEEDDLQELQVGNLSYESEDFESYEAGWFGDDIDY